MSNGKLGIGVHIDDLDNPAYLRGVVAGEEIERNRVIDRLERYFELVEYSSETEGAEPNEEWDNGFRAALALIKGKKNA